jgi:hypothetical protein
MTDLLTEKAIFTCGHGMTFRLRKKLPSALSAEGSPCLTMGDVVGAQIPGTCGAPPSPPATKPCTSIITAQQNSQGVLIAGDVVATSGVTGITDGTVGGVLVTFSVQRPNQSVLSSE